VSGDIEARTAAEGTVVRYQVDPTMSRFTIKVSASGLLAGIGHNPTIAIRDFAGEASFVPESLDGASLRVMVKPDSFQVTDDVNEHDKVDIENRMKQDVLETGRYREIAFESSSIELKKLGNSYFVANISGRLTLHGVTRELPIVCQVAVNGDTLRGYGELSVRQTDFGIRLVSVAGGTLKVKDEVKCSFDLVARK